MEDNLSFSLSDIAENENELQNRHERLKEMNSLFDAGIYLNMNYIPSLSKTFDDLKSSVILLVLSLLGFLVIIKRRKINANL